MNILSVVKNILLPDEFTRLIHQAEKFQRYTQHAFSFRDLVFNVPDFLSASWQIKEIFGNEELWFETISDIPVIYDCGANVGISVIYFKKLFPKAIVKALEPDPLIFQFLSVNISKNNIRGVELFQKAAWIDNGIIDFSSDGADGGSMQSNSGRKIQVPSVRLKDILAKETVIDMLKIDVEGAEVDLMSDISSELKRVNYLFVEYHSWVHLPQQLDRLLAILSTNGFRYYIRSINSKWKNPFISKNTSKAIDIQLNIHAARKENKKYN